MPAATAGTSTGVGTFLIRALERRALDRGVLTAALSVEHDNPRARALYERLGYVAGGDVEESWEQLDADGRPMLFRTMCTQMSRPLEQDAIVDD